MEGAQVPAQDTDLQCSLCECVMNPRACSCPRPASYVFGSKDGHHHSTVPRPGMGATQGVGSDRYPYTIVSVAPNGRTLWARRCEFVRTDKNGMSESQSYDYFDDGVSPGKEYTLRKNGRWVSKGQPMSSQGLWPGHRAAYMDPSF